MTLIDITFSNIRYWLARVGWPLVSGVLMIAATVLFYLSVDLSTQHQYSNAKQEAIKMQAVFVERQQNMVSVSPAAAIAAYYKLLPSEADTPKLMEQLFDAAYENDLALEQGSFKLVRDTDAAMTKYLVILPVQGSYLNVRKFVNRVLTELPSASLDHAGFHRDDVQDEEVSAELQFTLYLSNRGRQ